MIQWLIGVIIWMTSITEGNDLHVVTRSSFMITCIALPLACSKEEKHEKC